MTLPPDLAAELNRLGVIAQPQPQQPKPATDRPDGQISSWRGVYYPDGEIPF